MGAGAVTNVNSDGWRYIFWMQAAFHGATALGLFAFYWPPKVERPKFTLREILWSIDPVGSFLFVTSATLMLLALDWASGAYSWSDAHVAVPLGVGLALLVLFGLYGEFPLNVTVSDSTLSWELTGLHRYAQQSGKAAPTGWSHTSSSSATTTLHSLSSLLRSRAGSSTVPSTLSRRSLFLTLVLRATLGTLAFASYPTL